MRGDLRCDHKQDCFDGSDEEDCHESAYSVRDLYAIFSTITSNSFTITWKSPNKSLSFKYLPSYSVDYNESALFNATWIADTNFTFTNLHSGQTYKVFVFVLLNQDNNNGKIYTPNTFIKVTTAALGKS